MNQGDTYTIIQFVILVIAIIIGLYIVVKNPNTKNNKKKGNK